MGNRLFRLVAAVLIGGASASAGAQALEGAVQTPEAALAQDAAEYARLEGVDPAEAARRLRAQEESVAATEALQTRFRKRLAGTSFEHRPDYRIVVLLTGRKPVADETITADGLTIPVIFRTGAPATRERILKAISERGDAIRSAFPGARGMGVDPRTGSLVLMMSEGDTPLDVEALGARLSSIAGVPARVRVLEREMNFAVEGGARVEGTDTVSGRHAVCTAGFVVTDGARTGIVTAAHCPDVLTYVRPAGGTVELPFVGQWGWSFQDVQVNASDEAQRPVFYTDSKKQVGRTLRDQRSRAATRAGDVVCHRGERSGYSCGEVELTDYAPPGELCGGPCAPVWVTVRGPSCGGGDSGGPIFLGNTAFGIVKGGTTARGGRCAFYYYMSLDYLPGGWSLLKEPLVPAPAAPGEGPPRVGTPP